MGSAEEGRGSVKVRGWRTICRVGRLAGMGEMAAVRNGSEWMWLGLYCCVYTHVEEFVCPSYTQQIEFLKIY